MSSLDIILSAAGVATTSYWIATLDGTSSDFGQGIVIDSSGNVYVTGHTTSQGQGSQDVLIAKYNSSGTIQWQRTLGGSASDLGQSIDIDSSGNVYIAGYTTSGGAGSQDFLITKYDSSGTIQWQCTLGGGAGDIANGITVDSSDNVYVTGYTASQGQGGQDLLLAKYDSSGTIQWQRTLGTYSTDVGYGIATDSSGNVYIAGYTNSSGAGLLDVLIAKYDSSGTIQWQRTLGGSSTDIGLNVTTDSSGNVYVTGYVYSQGQGNEELVLAKYNSSGTIQWQQILGGSSTDVGYDVATDSSGNVYVTGYTDSSGAGSLDVLIAKYNSSGTIQWQRTLGGNGNDDGKSIDIDSSGNVYVTGYTNSTGGGTPSVLIAKLPGDGSLTGTYGNFTYAASTLTSATSTLTSATSTLTSATSTLTSATSTLTSATSTLTSTTITL